MSRGTGAVGVIEVVELVLKCHRHRSVGCKLHRYWHAFLSNCDSGMLVKWLYKVKVPPGGQDTGVCARDVIGAHRSQAGGADRACVREMA